MDKVVMDKLEEDIKEIKQRLDCVESLSERNRLRIKELVNQLKNIEIV